MTINTLTAQALLTERIADLRREADRERLVCGARLTRPRRRRSPRLRFSPTSSSNLEVTSAMDLTDCPECAAPAEIEWRAVLESTDGPIEHAKVLCVNQHWFLLPVASLVSPRLHEDQAGSVGESADRPSAVDGEPRLT